MRSVPWHQNPRADSQMMLCRKLPGEGAKNLSNGNAELGRVPQEVHAIDAGSFVLDHLVADAALPGQV